MSPILHLQHGTAQQESKEDGQHCKQCFRLISEEKKRDMRFEHMARRLAFSKSRHAHSYLRATASIRPSAGDSPSTFSMHHLHINICLNTKNSTFDFLSLAPLVRDQHHCPCRDYTDEVNRQCFNKRFSTWVLVISIFIHVSAPHLKQGATRLLFFNTTAATT